MASKKSTSTSPSDEQLEDPAAPPGGAGLLDLKPARWALIYGLPAVTCLLAGAAIYVSRLSVEQDVLVLTQEEWRSGEKAALRVVVFDDAGRLAERVRAGFSLSGEGREPVVVAEAGLEGAPALDLIAEVPSWPDGDYALVGEVETPMGPETVRTTVRLRGAPTGEAKLFRPPPPPDREGPTKTKVTLGELNVELLPRGAGLVPNLSNLLFLRTTDAQGRPVSAEVGLKLLAGLSEPLPERERTNKLGLSVLNVYPDSNNVTVDVSIPSAAPAEAADGGPADAGSGGGSGDGGPGDADVEADAEVATVRTTIFVPTTPAQLVMRAHHPIGEAAESLEVRVQSLHSSRPVFVDAYEGGRWIAARTGSIQGNKALISLPGLPAGIALIQAYTASLEVGYGYAAHHHYLREAGQSDTAALRAIAEELRRRELDRPYVDALLSGRLLEEPGGVELAAAFLLSRLDQGYAPPPLRVSSERVRTAELEGFQRSFRWQIAVAIGIIGLIVTTLLAYAFSLAAWKARQQRKLLEADVGGDEDALYVTSMGRPKGLDRFRVVLQIMLMVGVVAAGFFLIAILMSAMTW